MTKPSEKLIVKIGAGVAISSTIDANGEHKPRLMTREQAQRYGEARIDKALKRAGFRCYVARSDPDMHGGDWFRINYMKSY